jgi:molybdenum cofactor synthesis domain-containing protein
MTSSGADKHREAAGHGPVSLALVTVSDSRTPETDDNGIYLRDLFTGLGHHIVGYKIVKDEPDQVAAVLDEMAAIPSVQLILFNGGTGIAPRDTTYDVIARKLEKVLPGFGEIFDARLTQSRAVGRERPDHHRTQPSCLGSGTARLSMTPLFFAFTLARCDHQLRKRRVIRLSHHRSPCEPALQPDFFTTRPKHRVN